VATEAEIAEAVSLPELILRTATAAAIAELLPAVLVVEGAIRTRVFTLGQKADGSSIGSYSTKPYYAHLPSLRARYGSTLPLSGLKPRGKPLGGKKRGGTNPIARINEEGEREFRERTGVYFAGGYAEFRTTMNRQADRVDLMLSGAMAESMQTGMSGNEATIAFTREEEAEKADAAEVRFGGAAGDDEPVIFIATREDAEGVIAALVLASDAAVAKLFTQ
jgi:hypothetical protein